VCVGDEREMNDRWMKMKKEMFYAMHDKDGRTDRRDAASLDEKKMGWDEGGLKKKKKKKREGRERRGGGEEKQRAGGAVGGPPTAACTV